MEGFTDFNEWCHYWSNEFGNNIYKWKNTVNKGIDSDDCSQQYICQVEFKSETDGAAAMKDIGIYGCDKGYGNPADFIDNEYNDKYWDVYLTCPNLPLVIRFANNHGGPIVWWNEKFLKCPPKHIPFYIPDKPAPKPKKSGCYIATAIYGNYDCPEVWTLRRYRDNVLDNIWYGRLFIRSYYTISPTIVRWFGNKSWFRKLLVNPLNKWVNKLNKQGVENTPYCDKY